MMRRKRATVPSLIAVLAAMAAAAQAADLPGDPIAGRQLALQSCSGCHVVVPRQAPPAMDGAPPFVTVARDPAVTPTGLRVFLQTPHARMPDLILSHREIDDVVSYILTLRR